MQNPFGSQQVPGSYVDLHQIFEIVKNAYDQALARENVVLSRPEITRMLSQIMKLVLEDMIKKLK
jgi:hypothetical protein